MSEKIVQLNEAIIKSELKELVRGSVEETLNELLEAGADKLTQAVRYERNEQRQGYTVAVTTAAISPLHQEMLPSEFLNSKGSLLRRLSLRDIAAVRAVWKKPSLRGI